MLVRPRGLEEIRSFKSLGRPTLEGAAVDLIDDFGLKSNRIGDPLAVAEEIRDIARAVRRISPYSSDPERFFRDKETAIERLFTLAQTLERAA
ncbi:MAG: hypothetical protein AcusKO_14600 [Acuticoccus sp.]